MLVQVLLLGAEVVATVPRCRNKACICIHRNPEICAKLLAMVYALLSQKGGCGKTTLAIHQTLTLGEYERAHLDLDSHFTDPDGDALAYEVVSSNTHVAEARVSNSTVTLVASHLGRANVRVTARDPGGLTATERFSVTVEQGSPRAELEIWTWTVRSRPPPTSSARQAAADEFARVIACRERSG